MGRTGFGMLSAASPSSERQSTRDGFASNQTLRRCRATLVRTK